MASINLLDAQRREIVRKQALAGRLSRWVTLAVVMLLVVVGFLFGVRYWLSLRVKSVSDQKKQKQSEVKGYSDVARDGFVVSKKLESVLEVLKGRETLKQKVDLFFDAFETGVEIRSVAFGGDDLGDGLLLVGRAESVTDFNVFFEEMNKIASERGYMEVVLDDLSRGEDGSYRFAYKVSLAGGGNEDR